MSKIETGAKKTKKLLIEQGTVIIILFLISILINGVAIIFGSSYRFQLRRRETSKRVMIDIMGYLNSSSLDDDKHLSYGWMLDFWQEHPKEVRDRTSDMDAATKSINDLAGEYDTFSPFFLSAELVENLPFDKQADLAAVEYIVENNYMYSGFSEGNLDPKSYTIRAFLLNEDKGFVLFQTDPEAAAKIWDGEDVIVPSSLGDSIDFEIDKHPAAMKAMETGEYQEIAEKDYSLTDEKAVLNYYAPIIENGEAVGLIQLSLDWTENMRSIWQNSAQIEIVNLLVHLIICILILLMAYRQAVTPLMTIQQYVRDYKENKDSDQIVEKTKKLPYRNEFGILADDIASMAEEMDRYTNEVSRLSGEEERKNTELSIASTIQMQNLPTVFPAFPDRKDFDIYAAMTPAREVGGDFYDYFFIDDDHLALVVADVSDKGVPAALFMMMAKTRLNAVALLDRLLSPAEILRQTNDVLAQNNDTGMFVTVWLGILTLSTGELLTANGGHEDPAFCINGSFSLYHEKHGLALGLFPGMEFEENRWELKRGDMIFVYTDGLVETFNDKEEQFGTERMLNILNEDKNRELKEIVTQVKTAVDDHAGAMGPFDDVTMLALRLT